MHSNSSLLPPSLLPALDAQDFDGLIQFLLSSISTGHKEIFLPFYFPPETQFELHVTGNPPIVQIKSKQVIKIEPMTHLDLLLDLQVLNRSTHLVLHPQYKGGDIFLSSLFSTSVMAKHEFKQAFLFNCTPQIIRIPSGYVFYTISGLLNFPSEKGDVLQIQHLDGIIPLSSAFPLFTAQAGQLFQEKEKEFILTCQNFICSTYQLFHPNPVTKKEDCDLYDFGKPATLFPAYPFSSSPCKTTSQNIYFNFCDVIVNPTKF